MLTICYRLGKMGETAYEHVLESVNSAGINSVTEMELPEEYNVKNTDRENIFGGRWLQINTDSIRGCIILDEHKEFRDKCELYFHAAQNCRIPSGISRMVLLGYNSMFETSYKTPINIPRYMQQVYLEATDIGYIGRITGIIQEAIAQKENKQNGAKPTFIVHNGRDNSMSAVIEKGIGALREAVESYDLDILGSIPLGSLESLTKGSVCILTSNTEARKYGEKLKRKGIDVLVFKHSCNCLEGYYVR